MSQDSEKPVVIKGLKGVNIADSTICKVDGVAGKLMYRGYDIDDLATRSCYEEVCYLLLKGKLPNAAQLDEFRARLLEEATVDDEVLQHIASLPASAHPMSCLRSAIAYAGALDPAELGENEQSHMETCIRLTAEMTTMVAAIKRVRAGEPVIAPNPQLGFAANFMWMLTGEEPSADMAKAMDLLLILHAEHGLNASTFAGRVISATLSDLYSAITGAVGALKGKLHGGANTEVLRTLQELGSVEAVGPWVQATRAAKGKFMGFGHAVYQTQDPRAKHLKEYSQRLASEAGDPRWYDMSVEIEKLVVAEINRQCNVDFFSASVQHYMGIPGELFTCVFAASRIVGWCAHILEQWEDNKIIRPSVNYVGPNLRPYPPMNER